jgi:hypothetical protein
MTRSLRMIAVTAIHELASIKLADQGFIDFIG